MLSQDAQPMLTHATEIATSECKHMLPLIICTAAQISAFAFAPATFCWAPQSFQRRVKLPGAEPSASDAVARLQ